MSRQGLLTPVNRLPGSPSLGVAGHGNFPMGKPQHLTNRYGEMVKRSTIFGGLSGAQGGPGGRFSPSSPSIIYPVVTYIIGIQFCATFIMTVFNPRSFAFGENIGPVGGTTNVWNSFYFVVTENHYNTAGITQTSPLSKSGSMFFDIPFLPVVQAGVPLSIYASDDIGNDERILGFVTVYSIPKYDA